MGAGRFDTALYQIGNSAAHRGIYERALREPGVAVIHDAVLNHFYLSTMTEEEYCGEFVYHYGEWARAEARTLWNDRAAAGIDRRYFERPMLRRIAEASRVLVVHNLEARNRVLAHAPGAKVVEIPHFYVPAEPPDAALVTRFRGKSAYLFGVFGYLRESKRLAAVLKAFGRLRKTRGDVELLIAGEFHSSDLARAVESPMQAPGVRRLGHMSEREFALAAEAVDCCVNLRSPSAGETSGIGVRMMGIGKVVMCTDGNENAALPDHAYLAVEPGLREEEHLFELMALLASTPELGREMGQRAKRHVLRYHSIQAASEQYWNILCALCQ